MDKTSVQDARYLRLRQLCLVAADLHPVVEQLCTILGATVCFRDPEVARFGLHNALVRIGSSFIEVVAPTESDTVAERYLESRGGDSGYMVILDSEGLGRWRDHIGNVDVRIALDYQHGDFSGLQLHPRDTGGALLEINHTVGGQDVSGAYGPAGPEWQRSKDASNASAILGAVLQSPDPERLARRWSIVLQRPVVRRSDELQIELDNAHLRFISNVDGRGEGLAGIDINPIDATAMLTAADRLNCLNRSGSIFIGGVDFFVSYSP